MNHGGMGVTRNVGTPKVVVFQGTNKDIQVVQGGFLLTQTGLAKDDLIQAGTPVVFDEIARTATVLKTGIFQATAGGSATSYTLLKGHLLKVGDNLASGAVGGKAYPITAIDTTTSTVFDTVTVGTTIGAVTAGDLAYASTATGATASALPAANGLLYADTIANPGYGVSITPVVRATVYARRVPYSAAIAALTGLKFIIWSQSK